MSVPLATLLRQSNPVWLHDAFSSLPGTPAGTPLVFERAEHAADYLRFWSADPAALTVLRYALYRCEHSPSVFAMPDAQVLQALAAKLARGALVLRNRQAGAGTGGWPLVPATEAAVPASSTLINLNTLPDRPAVPPLLPLLEEVQIEGAEVLPEIEQTLEQIDLTMGSIDLAGVSLEPTPSKVPLIETAMTDASTSVTKTLDDL
ncbi:hypothetical protein [Polaromonas sp.]|uniref:hypothetical protein n=1 Tax=Polaromonas sp. TaxID=1869339 RepID=UPI003CADD5A6